MPATITQARDQMLALLKAAVDAFKASTMPATQFVLMWDDVAEKPAKPEPPTPWARVKVKHSTGRQTSLAGSTGRKRYTRGGFLVVQLFVPAGKGLVSHDVIVNMILAAYEGKTTAGGLIFRNCRFQEVGEDGPWQQTNVFVDFEYDEIK